MGQYKVPQNVEAEDKIIGPLTFKQFVYAIIGVMWAGLAFLILNKFLAVFLIVAAPGTFLFLMLAFYSRDGQNFEQLLIAIAGFYSQSRKRLWVKEAAIVTFKVEPRKVEEEISQRNPAEVRSELDRLASTIDSRGWNQPPAVTHEGLVTPGTVLPSTRLVEPEAPSASETPEPTADMLDLKESPLALNLAQLINDASADVRAEAIDQMNEVSPAKRTAPSTSVTTPAPQAILNLATERDDLTVSQIAATATRMTPLTEGQSVTLPHNGSQTK
jgi:hypothetical protein